MGGIPPLGYRPDGRTLAIVPEQAALVRDIYRRYLEVRNVRLLAEALQKDGILAPERTTATGKKMGGRPFTRGQLYLMLGCRTYRGEVRHHDAIHPGLHEAIVGQDLWDAVQAMLASNRQGHRSRHRAENPSLLAGLVTDDRGEPLVAVHATRGKVRYRYYVSRALHHGESSEGMRIPARELENIVVERLAILCGDPLQLAIAIDMPLESADLPTFAAGLQKLAEAVKRRDGDILRSLVSRIEVRRVERRAKLALTQF
ncbi:recombinase family protein [Sphingobium sp. EM0848]|uniref:recombinase family protein n=1 Tax=Sphingobium sp. EM0848 TaxID=2743473 RepID=UPI00159C4906|nr:recombinase family protein [Sphingobium sp. EM0848]